MKVSLKTIALTSPEKLKKNKTGHFFVYSLQFFWGTMRTLLVIILKYDYIYIINIISHRIQNLGTQTKKSVHPTYTLSSLLPIYFQFLM